MWRFLSCGLAFLLATAAMASQITLDPVKRIATISDAAGRLRLTVSYRDGCRVTSARVLGREVLDPSSGVWTGLKSPDGWVTSRSSRGARAQSAGNRLVIRGILFGANPLSEETWTFTAGQDIRWRIDRDVQGETAVDDSAMPAWTFADMSTWTGALLGTGGVAWCKLFDAPNASYAVHDGRADFWNAGHNDCLHLRMLEPSTHRGVRFTRDPSGSFTLAFQTAAEELRCRNGQARFSRSNSSIWAPFKVGSHQSATYSLSAEPYEDFARRGDFKGVDGNAVREIMNTIGRIGVIDDGIMGSNGWYSGYAVLHEPWIALMGLAVDDPNYTRNMARALDKERDQAILPDGMVKSRWAYGSWDAEPGTYDANGFYECQWGRLMDTQPSYVINVAEQFDQSGDVSWVRSHKASGEAALDYLLRRDTNGNGLVEMATDSQAARKASDWLDVIWASFENAFVNAQMYRALVVWSEIEAILGDRARHDDYAARAATLKTAFNRPISEGGFWDPDKHWYVYWREKDGAIRGNNLTLPVNFMAIAYGLCDDPGRTETILSQVESAMVKESLFCWPANVYTFLPGETDRSDFPNYENGDIFLAWAEAGIRAYARTNPKVALKYVRNVLERYAKDGLAFQRYLRKDQSGAGDDILANNCSAVVGLYRDIYGIQPKHNRLYLEPHLAPDLDGTVVQYELRGAHYEIALAVGRYGVAAWGWGLRSAEPFGFDFDPGGVEYFAGNHESASLRVRARKPVLLAIDSWSAAREFSASAPQPTRATFTLSDLDREAFYTLRIGAKEKRLRATNAGTIEFRADLAGDAPVSISIRRAP